MREISVDDARRYSNPIEFRQPLEPGDYRLEVEFGDGRRAGTAFTVTSLDATAAPNPRVVIE